MEKRLSNWEKEERSQNLCLLEGGREGELWAFRRSRIEKSLKSLHGKQAWWDKSEGDLKGRVAGFLRWGEKKHERLEGRSSLYLGKDGGGLTRLSWFI